MFKRMIQSEGLAHNSYIVGDAGKAAVIDPRRDSRIYEDIACEQGCRITHILETHRNEDYVIGSRDLSRRTGAQVFRGDRPDCNYGNKIEDGQQFEFGDLVLTALHTPGHTLAHMSYSLADTSFSDDALCVFTGDCLFIGDVGRTDFYPDKPEEMAAMQYESIHNKLLPLGDQAILHPAHGAGSVCGISMASREFSTLGYERRHNTKLQLGRDEFINAQVNEHHYKPAYFKRMEQYNDEGPPLMDLLPRPLPCSADEFAEVLNSGVQQLDIRASEAFAGCHIGGSLNVPLDMIPAYAGWFLNYEEPIALIVEDYEQVCRAVRYLIRMGYDNVYAYLKAGMHGWAISGRNWNSIGARFAGDIKDKIKADGEFVLLDVRSEQEWQAGHLPHAKHIYLGELPNRLDELPNDRKIVTFCGSGRRAMIAAGILKRNNILDVENCFGSMQACKKLGCPIESGP